MALRCFRMTYGDGSEVIRWFEDDGAPWVQQVFRMRLSTGELEYTGNDPAAVFLVEGFKPMIDEGMCEEL